jgi:glycosyltransferase involved in cell wall biosynthesis
MRAAFITASLGFGGAERHSITLTNRLAERGHECHAVYVKDDPGQLERLRGAVSVRCLHARRYLDPAAVKSLAAFFEQTRPTVVVTANPYSMMYAFLAMRRSGARAPLAVTFHTTLVLDAKEWLQMLCYRPLFWAADCLVFVCEAQSRYWLSRKVAARSNLVIHNGVDPEYWKPASAEVAGRMRALLGYAAGDYVIGICAALRPEKNHLQLVDAVAALRSSGIAARALAIGDGPMREAIEARARSRGVAADVRITGFQQDVRPYLAACDTAVLCSTTIETFSLAALEAMALARPVVHSDIGGAAEMVLDGENGFLFPAGDTPALVRRLAELAEPALRGRMGAAARELVAMRFSERAMVERYETTLLKLETKWRQRDHLRRSAPAH